MQYILFAADSTPSELLVIVSVLVGCCVAWFVAALLSIACRPTSESAETWEFESQRRLDLRANSLVYQWFEPLVDELAAFNRAIQPPERLSAISHSLTMIRSENKWTAAEFCAMSQMEGIASSMLLCLIAIVFGRLEIVFILFPLCAWGYIWLAISTLHNKAKARMTAVKRRLPFAVDLMALMMDAGAGFLESLKTVVSESHGTPLAEEFSEIVARIDAAQGRHETLAWFQHRMNDEDIGELIVSINKGEELGTPLVEILKRQANQMRLKRSQWAEKAVGEAQVKLSFPEMLVMIACMFIVVAPFLLAISN